MAVALGIDTGGTYTDATLLDHSSGQVLAGAKALTTRHDLAIGIGQAIRAVLSAASGAGSVVTPDDIDLVGLSTTLATNAIVEGQGCPVALILIGYDPVLIEKYGRKRDLVTDDVVYVRGGHNVAGDQVAELDVAAVREVILARRDRVEAFAVSGYFSVRNPSHELAVKALIQELTASPECSGEGLPVTCGHELTSKLDAVRRATTAALNARLIPLLRDLVATVRHTLNTMGIGAPLMIVKGDGSLVRARWAMQRPVETILSGPAASVVGAWHLAGKRDVWVVDVGGTTTDIAALRDGRPRLNPEGARVGGWRTMIEAADVHTVGLGGDSHVRLDGNTFPGSDGVSIGPRRVVPLSWLATQYPQVVEHMQHQLVTPGREGLKGQFVFVQGSPGRAALTEFGSLLAKIADGPRSVVELADESGYAPLLVRQIEEMVSRRLVQQASFTPTDALHVLGRFGLWNVDAARLGAQLLARHRGLAVEDFCERVVSQVSHQVMAELVTKVLSDEALMPDWRQEKSATGLLARALGSVEDSDLGCQLALRQPVVAVGAPVASYLPRTADLLNTSLVIPEHADVANAVGAVAGGVVQRLSVLIRPLDAEKAFRAYLPGGIEDYGMLEEAVSRAEEIAFEHVERLARKAGARHIETNVERIDYSAPVQETWGQDVFVETELSFTAVGRPGLVDEGFE